MNRKLAKKAGVFLIAAAMLTMAACSNKTENKEASNSPTNKEQIETLKMAGGRDWGGPNPYRRTSRGPASQKVNLVFDSLLESGLNGPIPWLAKEYSVNGKEYTYVLNDNAKWHDGKPVTAHDVVFTVNYYKEHPPVGGGLGAGDKYIVEKAEAKDDKTVVITVKKQDASTFDTLGGFYILPKHIWEKVDDPKTYDGEDKYIGCGMYKLKSYEPSSGSYEYEAFEEYYGPKQVAKRVLFVPTSDELLAFDNHEIDITGLPLDLVDKYKKDTNIGVIETPNSFGYRMHINMEKNPQFKDVEMRKALYYAIDREKILNDVLRGGGAVGSAGYCPPTSAWYNNQVVQYKRDVEKAKKAFEGKNISLTLACADDEKTIKMAEIIKMNLAECGVEVKVKSTDSQTNDKTGGQGDYDLIIISNGGWGLEPSQLQGILTVGDKGSGPGTGVRGWQNEEMTKLIGQIKGELDAEKQKEMYKQLQMEMSKEAPIIILATSSSYSMFRKDYYGGWKVPYDNQQFTHARINYVHGDFK